MERFDDLGRHRVNLVEEACPIGLDDGAPVRGRTKRTPVERARPTVRPQTLPIEKAAGNTLGDVLVGWPA